METTLANQNKWYRRILLTTRITAKYITMLVGCSILILAMFHASPPLLFVMWIALTILAKRIKT